MRSSRTRRDNLDSQTVKTGCTGQRTTPVFQDFCLDTPNWRCTSENSEDLLRPANPDCRNYGCSAFRTSGNVRLGAARAFQAPAPRSIVCLFYMQGRFCNSTWSLMARRSSWASSLRSASRFGRKGFVAKGLSARNGVVRFCLRLQTARPSLAVLPALFDTANT